MQPPLPSVTPTWHNDTYDAIAPSRPELSAEGKTVIVAGAVRPDPPPSRRSPHDRCGLLPLVTISEAGGFASHG